MSVQPTRLVIGRFGRIGHGELKGELRNITFFCMVCKFSFFFFCRLLFPKIISEILSLGSTVAQLLSGPRVQASMASLGCGP